MDGFFLSWYEMHKNKLQQVPLMEVQKFSNC